MRGHGVPHLLDDLGAVLLLLDAVEAQRGLHDVKCHGRTAEDRRLGHRVLLQFGFKVEPRVFCEVGAGHELAVEEPLGARGRRGCIEPQAVLVGAPFV